MSNKNITIYDHPGWHWGSVRYNRSRALDLALSDYSGDGELLYDRYGNESYPLEDEFDRAYADDVESCQCVFENEGELCDDCAYPPAWVGRSRDERIRINRMLNKGSAAKKAKRRPKAPVCKHEWETRESHEPDLDIRQMRIFRKVVCKNCHRNQKNSWRTWYYPAEVRPMTETEIIKAQAKAAKKAEWDKWYADFKARDDRRKKIEAGEIEPDPPQAKKIRKRRPKKAGRKRK